MSKDSNLSKGLLIGFLTGSIVGAAVALLYAPKSGKELRKDIKDKTGEWMEEAEKYMDTAKEKAINVINEGKRKSEQLITDAKVKADQLIKDAEKVVSDARGAVKAGVEAYKDSKNA